MAVTGTTCQGQRDSAVLSSLPRQDPPGPPPPLMPAPSQGTVGHSIVESADLCLAWRVEKYPGCPLPLLPGQESASKQHSEPVQDSPIILEQFSPHPLPHRWGVSGVTSNFVSHDGLPMQNPTCPHATWSYSSHEVRSGTGSSRHAMDEPV